MEYSSRLIPFVKKNDAIVLIQFAFGQIECYSVRYDFTNAK